MVKRWLSVGIMLLLMSLLAVGCGIPKEDYEAVVTERDMAQAELQSVSSELELKKTELQTTQSELETVRTEFESTKTELQSVQDELDTAKSSLTSMQSNLSRVTSASSSLKKKLALVEQVLVLQSTAFRSARAKTEGNQEEVKSQNMLGLSIFKSFDSLVADIGDFELSKSWGATWPESYRSKSEQEKMVWLDAKAFANFMDRLSELVQSDAGKL